MRMHENDLMHWYHIQEEHLLTHLRKDMYWSGVLISI